MWRGETGAPCVCFAHCEASGLCVAGDADGRLAAYDVARGERVWFHTDNTDTRPTAVAVGAGVVVVGFADGTTRAFELASGRRLRARGATMASAVTCAAVDGATGRVAAAAGADVRRGRSSSVGTERSGAATWLVGHEEPVRCGSRRRRVAAAAVRTRASAAASARRGSARARPETRRARPALLTAGDDATTRAWDASSGACVLELEGPPGTTEAEHAGQVPVEWTYTPPPGITALDTWCGLVVEGRADGSVLVWTGALEGIARAMRDLDEEEAVRAAPSPSRERRDESAKKTKTDAKERARSPSRDASSSNPKPQNLEMVTGDGSGSGRLVDDDSVFRDTIEAFPSREDRGRGDRGDDDEKKKKGEESASSSRRAAPPATYRRWWAHGDRVTRVVANRGRVVSVALDGSCHVLALSADTLARAARWKADVAGASASAPRRRPARRESAGAAAAPALGGSVRDGRGGGRRGARRRDARPARRRVRGCCGRRGRRGRAAHGGELERDELVRRRGRRRSRGACARRTRLSGGLVTDAAFAAETAWTVSVSYGQIVSASAASAAARAAHAAASVTASAAAETASIAERLGREVGRGASSMSRSASDAVSKSFGAHGAGSYGFWVFEDGGAAFFPGFGFGGYARGWTFREHASAGIECVAVTGQMLITADVDGNVVVRHFGDRAAVASNA